MKSSASERGLTHYHQCISGHFISRNRITKFREAYIRTRPHKSGYTKTAFLYLCQHEFGVAVCPVWIHPSTRIRYCDLHLLVGMRKPSPQNDLAAFLNVLAIHLTRDQALFSFRFENNTPAGKAKRKESGST